jgi:GxxExxY protein
MTENEIGKVVVNAAIAIHKALGSGLYEIVYEVILTHELKEEWFKC